MFNKIFVLTSFISYSHFSFGCGTDLGTLKNNMQSIASFYTILDRQIDDPAKNKESVTVVQNMIAHSKSAKHAPPNFSKVNLNEKAKVKKMFHEQMGFMIDKLNATKTALNSNDNKQARVHFEELRPYTDPGHIEKFKSEPVVKN